jgi:short subunit dehydrogenase-like uncharacterized protein
MAGQQQTREFDVVVFGATGFVGALTARYLAKNAPDGVRIALAGRNPAKLEAIRGSLPGAAADWPVVVADSADPTSLRSLAERTTAVATTVGPYAKYGLPLVEACAAAGTHYADLTGEVRLVRAAIDRFDAAARDSGARIVVSCGFDSIPSDLGVLVLNDEVRRDGGGDLESTTLVVTALKGGVSGGTLASLKGQIDEMKADRSVRSLVSDPYALSPDRAKEPDLGDEADLRRPLRDRELGRWLAPFVMSAYNSRIVRRSNALQDWEYGRAMRYQEVMGFSAGPTGLAAAAGVTAGVGLLAGGLMLKPTRAVLDRVLPDPGEGPSEKVQRTGYFTIEIHTVTSLAKRYLCRVTGQGDPGYAGTAVMLGESVLALGTEPGNLPAVAGVLTPATGIGRPLVERLRRHGFTFDASTR